MQRVTTAYNAGKHVHNFFAMIGHGIAVGVTTVGRTVRDFGAGVKDGGPAERHEKQSKAGGRATA